MTLNLEDPKPEPSVSPKMRSRQEHEHVPRDMSPTGNTQEHNSVYGSGHSYALRLLSYFSVPCPARIGIPAWVSHTLVSDPLSLLNGLWPRTQGHEVALDDMLGVVRVEPQRHRPGEMILFESIIATGHQAALLIHGNCLRQRGRLGQRRKIGREAC